MSQSVKVAVIFPFPLFEGDEAEVDVGKGLTVFNAAVERFTMSLRFFWFSRFLPFIIVDVSAPDLVSYLISSRFQVNEVVSSSFIAQCCGSNF